MSRSHWPAIFFGDFFTSENSSTCHLTYIKNSEVCFFLFLSYAYLNFTTPLFEEKRVYSGLIEVNYSQNYHYSALKRGVVSFKWALLKNKEKHTSEFSIYVRWHVEEFSEVKKVTKKFAGQCDLDIWKIWSKVNYIQNSARDFKQKPNESSS